MKNKIEATEIALQYGAKLSVEDHTRFTQMVFDCVGADNIHFIALTLRKAWIDYHGDQLSAEVLAKSPTQEEMVALQGAFVGMLLLLYLNGSIIFKEHVEPVEGANPETIQS